MQDEGGVSWNVVINNGYGIQLGAGNTQTNSPNGGDPLDPAALSQLMTELIGLSPHGAAGRLQSLKDDELARFFAWVPSDKVGAIFAALWEGDKVKAVATLKNINQQKAAELINASFAGANRAAATDAARRRHPLDDVTEPLKKAATADLLLALLARFREKREKEVPVADCPACGIAIKRGTPTWYCKSCRGRLLTELTEAAPVKPDAILPFRVGGKEMGEIFAAWVSARRFAPIDLKATTEKPEVRPAYLPFWYFNSERSTSYLGARVNKPADVMRRGRPVAGTEVKEFTDIQVPACSVNQGKALSWPVDKAVAYWDGCLDFLGIQCDVAPEPIQYSVEPDRAFVVAGKKMGQAVVQDVARDCKAKIGGDVWRVENISTTYRQVTYTLVLLPVWFLSYTYDNKTWHVVINGYTRKVKGERPFDKKKLALTLLVALAVILVIVIALSLG